MAENPHISVARPPYSNRGVYPLIDQHNSGGQNSHFDAYCATVHAHPDLLLDHVENAIEEAGIRCRREQGPAVRYYRENWLFLDDQGNRLAQVRSGGNPHPFLECKGKLSGDIAAAIRGKLHHRPSRVDVAIDRSGPQLFVELDQLAKAFEKKYGLRRDYAGADVENDDRGTTIYLGSRLSQVFVRIYQKGLQLAEAMGLTGDDIPEELRNWVRIELEFKPQKTKAKQVAAVAEPSAFWGLSQWTADFAMQALSLVSERVNVSERRESDHQRALRFMAQQYRSHLQQLLHDCKGDYGAAMETLLDLADLLPAKAA